MRPPRYQQHNLQAASTLAHQQWASHILPQTNLDPRLSHVLPGYGTSPLVSSMYPFPGLAGQPLLYPPIHHQHNPSLALMIQQLERERHLATLLQPPYYSVHPALDLGGFSTGMYGPMPYASCSPGWQRFCHQSVVTSTAIASTRNAPDERARTTAVRYNNRWSRKQSQSNCGKSETGRR